MHELVLVVPPGKGYDTSARPENVEREDAVRVE